jgi:hypothetical protein
MKPVKRFAEVIENLYTNDKPAIKIYRNGTYRDMWMLPYQRSAPENPIEGDEHFWVMDKKSWGQSDIPNVIFAGIDWEKETIQYAAVMKQTGTDILRPLLTVNVKNMPYSFSTPDRFFSLVTRHITDVWDEFTKP